MCVRVLAEQACRERDKVKADLDHADQRNLQLVREVDDRHASMENLNQSRIRSDSHIHTRSGQTNPCCASLITTALVVLVLSTGEVDDVRSVLGRDLEQEFRDRLTALRSQVEQESDVLLQQVEQERGTLQEELWLLRAQETALQEELKATAQVSSLPWLSVRLPVPVFNYLEHCLLSLVSEFLLITNRCLIDPTSCCSNRKWLKVNKL